MKTTYYYGPGACSFAGQVVLEWIAQPYTLCRVERAVRRSDAYAHINPLKKVPALQVDERVITENPAILTHLAERKPGILPAHGTALRDLANQWMAYITSTLHVAYGPYFTPSTFSAYEAHAPALRQQAQQRVRQELGIVNRALNRSGFLVGLQVSAVDMYLYAVARWARSFCDMPRDFPHVHRLLNVVELDPVAQFVLATEKGETAKAPSGACTHQILT